ncbi:hypothetical protein ACG02S_17835 [Roseateles sp. DC23W]|uniref:Capsule polysaccharide biosynthesis protein n=1 Tax=Pelomonas dachongensis TaxID=3299029 RepID=A0ABW7ESV2_9BURK
MTAKKKTFKNLIGEWLGINPLRWSESVGHMHALVDQTEAQHARSIRSGSEQRTIALVVTVWLTTWVPWYAVLMGLLLSVRGNRVVYIHDDLPFSDAPWVASIVRHFIRRVMRRLAARYQVINLSDFLRDGTALSDEALVRIARLAELNAVHKLRGETLAAGRSAYETLVRKQLRRALPAIERVVSEHDFDAIVMPGGVYGTSGLWIAAGEARGVRVSTYDAGAGLVLLAARGIAAQLQDIPAAFARVKQDAASPAQEAVMLNLGRAEIEKRHNGRSAFNYQQASGIADPLDPYKGAILIALNSSWDQAALGLHVVFKDSTEWIVESVRWILEHTDAKVVVRQHPAERFDLARTSDDYGALLRKAVGDHERLFFISAANPLNSYDLLSVSSAVLAYTSTFGVEASALGKPTITASRSYYADLGFVWSAKSRERYFELLGQAAHGQLTVTPAMSRDALLCYYTTQVCNWNFTHFNPVSDDFFLRPLADLLVAPDVDVILSVLETGTPSAVLNHEHQLRQHLPTADAVAPA